jgi:uncharacterized repeat protein (TIGR01451 family)
MFEKLLSSLPFKPSLIHQMSFYSKRMREEQSVRRIGLVFVVLAFLIQFFAFISPPQATLADSPNDLVNGGFSSAAQAASDCQSNLFNYGTILANYGITCAKVASASTLTINSRDWNSQLYSMGRLTQDIPGNTPVSIGGVTYYVRYLWGWDATGTTSNYQALNVTSIGGQTFLLLYACGNLTSVGFPQPVQQTPQLSISKTTTPGSPVAGSTVAPGTTLGFRMSINNSGGAASNGVISDPTPANTTFVSQGGGSDSHSFNSASNLATWNFTTVPAGETGYYVDGQYQVNADTPNGTQICNVASVKSDQTGPVNSNSVCMTVQVQAPPPVITTTTTPPPTVTVTPPPPKCPYDSAILLSSPSCVPCTTNTTIIASDSQCKSCEAALSSEDNAACVEIHKTAANLTQSISNADGTTAQAGDLIQYTLYADNVGTNTVKNYIFQDDLSYVLDYSSLVTNGGGTLSSNNDLVWAPQDIAAGKTISEQFEARVDNPIPQTPVSTSDPNYFNLIMSNTYGNTIKINLPPSPAQTIETTTTSLPNTGPGNSIIFGAIVMAAAGFFFYRSRLLAKESSVAVRESIAGGI